MKIFKKTFKKKFQKPLDKKQILCYNKDVKRKRTTLLKTRKGKCMTKKDALTIALNTIENIEAKSVIENMIAQLSKPASPEVKAKVNAKRKEAIATARAELLAKVVPVLRAHLTEDITAKELFEVAKDELPSDFSAPKVQNILIREMAPELVKTEAKGKANTYRLR